jgi:hypothetical protein
MSKALGVLTTAVAVTALLGALAQAGGEEKVPLDKLPKAVVDAVKAKFPDAQLKSAEKEKEDGKIVYEVNIKDGKHTIEVTVTPDGKLVSIEKEIEPKDLPKAVAEALREKYPNAKIKKAEELAKGDGKVTGYEMVIVTTGGQTLEVVFNPQGKFQKEEKQGVEKKEEKKDEK